MTFKMFECDTYLQLEEELKKWQKENPDLTILQAVYPSYKKPVAILHVIGRTELTQMKLANSQFQKPFGGLQ